MYYPSDFFVPYIHKIIKYAKSDIISAEALTGLLITASDEGRIDDFLCSALCSCAVAWAQKNPDVIALLEADYTG